MATFFTTGPITYRSKQQKSVASSTTEAEYVAAAMATKDLIWLQSFFEELKVPTSLPDLLCDNQSAIKLIKNPEFHDRTKHIDRDYHRIRELYEGGKFNLNYILSEKQKADMFTKAFSTVRFEALREMFGCVALP